MVKNLVVTTVDGRRIYSKYSLPSSSSPWSSANYFSHPMPKTVEVDQPPQLEKSENEIAILVDDDNIFSDAYALMAQIE